VRPVQPRRGLLRTKRRKILTAVAAVAVLAVAYCFAYEPGYSGKLVVKPSRTLVFGHRGFGNYGPDNSLYAVIQALDFGVDGVDVDGQLTFDDEIVIFHDLSVDRLTNSTGRVRDKTKAEMLALDLGPKYSENTSGANVRTFEDFVREVKRRERAVLMVELKVPRLGATGIEQRAVDIIRRNGAHAQVILSSFNPFVLYRIKRIDPNVRTCLIFMNTNWNRELLAEIKPEDRVNLPWMVRQEWIRRALRKVIQPDLLSINHEVPVSTTNRLIKNGWPVFIWTVNEERDIRAALAQHPYGIISDQPIRSKQLRDQ
jgi:glycerophosphoryl diester phosphodiesterase